MYTVQKQDTPDRGTLFAVVDGDDKDSTNVVSRFADEEEAKEFCLDLNGGERGEKRLKKLEEKAKEAQEAAAKADAAKSKTKPEATAQGVKPTAAAQGEHKSPAQHK
jgi:hypothetical protein